MYAVTKYLKVFIGLSKERPILGDNPKAHKFAWWKVLRFSLKSIVLFMKSGGFHWKELCFSLVLFTGAFHVKSAGAFHEKHRFSKDHLQGIVTLCFSLLKGENILLRLMFISFTTCYQKVGSFLPFKYRVIYNTESNKSAQYT